MEGLSDGRALKTILPQINPRKLVSLLSLCSFIEATPDHDLILGHC